LSSFAGTFKEFQGCGQSLLSALTGPPITRGFVKSEWKQTYYKFPKL